MVGVASIMAYVAFRMKYPSFISTRHVSHQNNRIFGQLSQFLNDGINRMSPAVHQNQIQIGELLHFFSYQRLHSHSAISIVRDKGNVFRFRIESLNHGDITFYIILIDKSRFQFGNIQMIFKDIDRFGHPAIKVSTVSFGNITTLLLARLHITGTFTCISSLCDK